MPFSSSGRRRVRTVITLAAILSGSAACSLLLDLHPSQCERDSDCDAFAAGLVCAGASCVAPATLHGGDAEGGAADGGASGCTSNKACIAEAFGEPAICSRTTRQCVPLKSETCPYVFEAADLKNDEAVVVGAFFPIGDIAVPLGGGIALAYALATKEIHVAGGIPSTTGQPQRPLVVVGCDTRESTVQAGVEHLVREVGVGALVGVFSQTNTATFVQNEMVPAKVFTLNPQDTTLALKSLDLGGLVWHLLGTPEDMALAYRPLLRRLERYLSSRVTPKDRPIRVAIAVTPSSPTLKGIEDVIRSDDQGLSFNQRSATANTSDGFLRRWALGAYDPATKFSKEAEEIASYEPDVVVLLTGDEAQFLAPQIDAILLGKHAPLPYYLLGPLNARSVLDYLRPSADAGAYRPALERFLGVQYAGTTDRSQPDAFYGRMADANSLVDPAVYQGTENYYDAIYWLAYGLYAAGAGAPPTGPSWATGVRRLLQGKVIHPGDDRAVTTAFSVLQAESQAKFVGAMGPEDIDPKTGTANSVGAVYCYPEPSGDPLPKVAPRYDVLRYERDAGDGGDFRSSDVYACIIGF